MSKICCCSLAGTKACVECRSKSDCVLYVHYQKRSPFTWHHTDPEYPTRRIGYFTKDAAADDEADLVHPI